MSNQPAISIQHVTKTFRGGVQALRGVSMRVDRGEIFGLLGPNGAGKSTLVKILMTVIRASQIEGEMLGEPIGHIRTLRRVGYLPEHHHFPPYLTAEQLLHYYGGLEGMRRTERRNRIGALLDLTGMTAWRRKRVGSFSKGMQQRVGIAQALMHNPELLLLDEPTDGVDPVGRREIRQLLLHLQSEGHTVLVNSHILAELEPLCSQVAILVKGTVAREGSLKELTADSHRWELDCSGDTPGWIPSFPGLTAKPLTDGVRLSLPGHDEATMQRILDRVRADGQSIRRIDQLGESLEELFMRSLDESPEADAAIPGATTRKMRQ